LDRESDTKWKNKLGLFTKSYPCFGFIEGASQSWLSNDA